MEGAQSKTPGSQEGNSSRIRDMTGSNSAFQIYIHKGIIRNPNLKSNSLTNRMQDKVQ